MRPGGVVWLGLSVLLVVSHEIALRALDHARVMEQLLSPVGAPSPLALLGALAFVFLRLAVVWLVPGLLVMALVSLVRARVTGTPRGRSPSSPGRRSRST
jgi:hypothetical protein